MYFYGNVLTITKNRENSFIFIWPQLFLRTKNRFVRILYIIQTGFFLLLFFKSHPLVYRTQRHYDTLPNILPIISLFVNLCSKVFFSKVCTYMAFTLRICIESNSWNLHFPRLYRFHFNLNPSSKYTFLCVLIFPRGKKNNYLSIVYIEQQRIYKKNIKTWMKNPYIHRITTNVKNIEIHNGSKKKSQINDKTEKNRTGKKWYTKNK